MAPTFEKCRPIFELKVKLYFNVNVILSALQAVHGMFWLTA